jgi:hypothetical protein
MRHAPLATIVVVPLVGTHAVASFSLRAASVINEESITPSAGSFITQQPSPGQEGAGLTDGWVSVKTDHDTWFNDFDTLMASTWLAVDPYGPKGVNGTDAYGTGWSGVKTDDDGHDPIHIPTFNSVLTTPTGGLAVNGQNGDPVDGDGRSPGFVGGSSGFAWGAGVEDAFNAFSGTSSVNGAMVDSVFLGHFVLTDPNAILVGADLLLTINYIPHLRAPLDGGILYDHHDPGSTWPLRIEYERTTFSNSLGTFTALDMYLVQDGFRFLPAPGTGALALLAPLTILRRRRGA